MKAVTPQALGPMLIWQTPGVSNQATHRNTSRSCIGGTIEAPACQRSKRINILLPTISEVSTTSYLAHEISSLSSVTMSRTKTDRKAINGHGNGRAREEDGPIKPAMNTRSVREPHLQERTDYSRWRMLDERGRQTWHYLEDDQKIKEWPQSTADKYFLGLPTV